jgi:single-strand DNA-binding protein
MMNKSFFIGNLTRKPELSRTPDGTPVCNFTIAVPRRVKKGSHPEADYVRVAVWRKLGESCAQYLDKGRKVCVVGPVRAHAYNGNDGSVRACLEMDADDVQFLTPKGATGQGEQTDDDLPETFTN